MPVVLRLEANSLPVVVLSVLCDFFLHFLLRVSVYPIICGMCFSPSANLQFVDFGLEDIFPLLGHSL
jgi:hypothetical protein